MPFAPVVWEKASNAAATTGNDAINRRISFYHFSG
jgi:hypothetical protein